MKVLDEEIKHLGEKAEAKLAEIFEFTRNLTQIDPRLRGDPQNRREPSGTHCGSP